MTTPAALCATLLPTVGDLWFSTDRADRAQAKRICRACPLLTACRATAMADHTTRGVWGGMSTGERRWERMGRRDGLTDPDDWTDAADTSGAVPVLTRQEAECGTEEAWRVHGRYGEDCARCQAAHEQRVVARRRARLEEEHRRGGSSAGAATHRRLGERPCEMCLREERAKTSAARARRRAQRLTERPGAPGPGGARAVVLEPQGAAA